MKRAVALYGTLLALFLMVGLGQSWSVALATLNLCLISAIMALGVNIQWGYAGLFNTGIVGFAAIGGLVAVLVGHPPVAGAIAAGGGRLALGFGLLAGVIAAAIMAYRWFASPVRYCAPALILAVGYYVFSGIFRAASQAVEAYEPAASGFLGGAGLPILLSWPLAGLAAAGAAFLVGKVALGLRSDYLAIATLGISEIIVAFMKNEDWLTRGVKNATGLPRAVPSESLLQEQAWFRHLVEWAYDGHLSTLPAAQQPAALQLAIAESSSFFVKLIYAGLFGTVLAVLLFLCVLALNSPWGRMVRAIRDNEAAAAAMGKDVNGRHLQLLMLGSAVVGIAGAMLVTLDGQFTPASYVPLRFTFLIWVMVVVGGAGSNVGAVLGAFLIWFMWTQSEPAGYWLIDIVTGQLDPASPIRAHLLAQSQHFRVLIMGIILLAVLRFYPEGLLPERLFKIRSKKATRET